MTAKHSSLGNFVYTILTCLIILLGKLRNLTCKNANRTAAMRFDRTIPWCRDYGKNVMFMSCCDCGLPHLVCAGQSMTPVRTLKYSYHLRMGADAWTEPNTILGRAAYETAWRLEIVEEEKSE